MGVSVLDLFQYGIIATLAKPRNAGLMNRPVILYYAATMLFLLLDFVLGVNVRVAFLEPFPMA